MVNGKRLKEGLVASGSRVKRRLLPGFLHSRSKLETSACAGYQSCAQSCRRFGIRLKIGLNGVACDKIFNLINKKSNSIRSISFAV